MGMYDKLDLRRDRHASLNAGQIIDKLSGYGWEPDRFGVPRILIKDIPSDDEDFMRMCKHKRIVEKAYSKTLGGLAYYCYQPDMISALLDKEVYVDKINKDGQPERLKVLKDLSDIIKELGKRFNEGRVVQRSTNVINVVTGDMNVTGEKAKLINEHCINNKSTLEKFFTDASLAYSSSVTEKLDLPYVYRLKDTDLGCAILGCVNLIQKEKVDKFKSETAGNPPARY